ncbi:MAG: hypothetical protein HXS48_10875 [Theionarchaea archaeon]|nr:MAG: hypothetical protein AYK19_00865 [Theionarchaea archaeon DG-70-1]MBU7027428.1 hypothetical protein [Theionarchaea archaeon]
MARVVRKVDAKFRISLNIEKFEDEINKGNRMLRVTMWENYHNIYIITAEGILWDHERIENGDPTKNLPT